MEETNFIKMVDKVQKVTFKSNKQNIQDNSHIVRITQEFYDLITSKPTIFPYDFAKEFKNHLMALD